MKPKRPKPLTSAAVARLAMPPEKLAQLLLTGKPADHFKPDPTLPGFSARLRKESPQAEIARSWYMQKRRRDGTTYRESLGDIRQITGDEARKIARQRFAMLELGRDPRAEQEQAKAEARAKAQTLGPLSPST
jgi:Arm DNA-binding domain